MPDVDVKLSSEEVKSSMLSTFIQLVHPYSLQSGGDTHSVVVSSIGVVVGVGLGVNFGVVVCTSWRVVVTVSVVPSVCSVDVDCVIGVVVTVEHSSVLSKQ